MKATFAAAPAAGSMWLHRNGRLYEVLGVTNQQLPPHHAAKPGREVMVVYRPIATNEWFSRPLSQWEDSFTQQVSTHV